MKKLRVWDSDLLTSTYEKTSQIQANIEQLIDAIESHNVGDLPNSLVPTDTLYEVVLSFDLMFNLLLDKQLIETGNKKQDKNTIH